MKGHEGEEAKLTEMARAARVNVSEIAEVATPLLVAYAAMKVGYKNWRVEPAEDAVQDTLAKMGSNLDGYDRSQSFAPLLYTIVQRRYLDKTRAKKSKLVPLDPTSMLADGGKNPIIRGMLTAESIERIMNRAPMCWQELTLEDAMLLILSRGEEQPESILLVNDFDTFLKLVKQRRTLAELMAQLGQPKSRKGSIKAKLSRARHGLLKCLGAFDEE